MKNLEALNKYLSNCGVLVYKLHNLHWNVEGTQFMPVHKFTEELYEYFFDKFDVIAEIIKIEGETPLVKMSDYVKHASVKEIEPKAFTPKEVLEIVKADLEHMVTEATELRSVMDEDDKYTIVAELEDQMAYFKKQLWFIRATLKENN